MKKLLFGAVALFLMISCTGKGSSEKAKEDSARIADSIANVEAAKVAEQARLDSVRRDSMNNIQEFARVVKALENLPTDHNRLEGFLKRLGFKGSKKTSTKEENYFDNMLKVQVEKYYYTFTKGNKCITYSSVYETSPVFDNYHQKITIEGDENALDRFYRVIQEKGYSEVYREGNTVITIDGGC